METKKMVFPSLDKYPLSPDDVVVNHSLKVTHKYEIDSYLTQIAYFCSVKKSFYFSKDEFYKYLSSGHSAFFSTSSCDDLNGVLEKEYFLLSQFDGNIFLTSDFIIAMVGSSDKICLKHIEFDETPRKTEIEKLNPEIFQSLKALILHAKKEESYGPFNPDDFKKATELKGFLIKNENGIFLTPKLLTYLFKHYPGDEYITQ
jgi:hypothetical protein